MLSICAVYSTFNRYMQMFYRCGTYIGLDMGIMLNVCSVSTDVIRCCPYDLGMGSLNRPQHMLTSGSRCLVYLGGVQRLSYL